ncbi:hypothetical protein LEMA_P109780.1 [Plenodomus lingam JN3]|uniref:N-acetyltransferase domain-containing protein n=1 Tax=Leptosphaeria maculans (strain JN3 / isolate v23.1.3 / race Av1-4-5-6-7-8) TaxID=985895 RepID=E4ZZB8_LEPMJ|nr:hypothetical protein LEMA_P109780.1 [Plenodomus lingam JN3]CBX96713.1 hypothetical protein LEMA_P109780.1 [Plenodomus lingam JN3]
MHTRPLLHTDIPQIATISYTAYTDDKLYHWLHPGLKQYPQDYRRSRINSLRARLVRPGCHGFVVVDGDGGEVVGYAFFMRVAGGVEDEGAKNSNAPSSP